MEGSSLRHAEDLVELYGSVLGTNQVVYLVEMLDIPLGERGQESGRQASLFESFDISPDTDIDVPVASIHAVVAEEIERDPDLQPVLVLLEQLNEGVVQQREIALHCIVPADVRTKDSRLESNDLFEKGGTHQHRLSAMPMKGQDLFRIVSDVVFINLPDESGGVIEAYGQIASVVRMLVAVDAGEVAPVNRFDDVIHGV
jgi:hypothetical protein